MNSAPLVDFVRDWLTRNPGASKEALDRAVTSHFLLTKDGALRVGRDFVLRLSSTATPGVFSNTVVGFRKLVSHNDRPIIVCLMSPIGCDFLLANTTLIARVSHSSHLMRPDNFRGSINGGDILRTCNQLKNEPANFAALWEWHTARDHEEEIGRIVDATLGIEGNVTAWRKTPTGVAVVLDAVVVAAGLTGDANYLSIKSSLDAVVAAKRDAILQAARIENGKVRGEAIEALITGGTGLHAVGDLEFQISNVRILVDIKSKRADKSAAPKGWNIDKVLAELARGDSAVSMYFIRVDLDRGATETRLASIFDATLLRASGVQRHWSGRGARGAIQFSGRLDEIWEHGFSERVDVAEAQTFLRSLIDLAQGDEPGTGGA